MEDLRKKVFGFSHGELLICGFIGAVAFLLIYGMEPLSVTFDKWILHGYVEEDIIQHYTGWMAFRDSPWSFPLGLAENLGYPEGVVISFTDSLPLVSLVLKCFSGLLPETFQFFGWYTLLCFILQGISSGLLAGLFARKRWEIYGASVLFVFSPILLERAFRHTALASQWLILFALYLYFRQRKRGGLPWGFLALQVLCVGLHPYFVPMVCGILAAWLLECLWPERWGKATGMKGAENVRVGETGQIADMKRARDQAIPGKIKCVWFFLGNLLVLAITGYLLGIFGSGVSGSAGGFGYYSMNLNALWNPVSLGVERWSAILPVLGQRAGNYDGFNYLGAGVLLFGVLGLLGKVVHLLREQRLGAFCRSYGGLLLFCGFCTLFAWSHVVSFGDKELFTVPLPEMVEKLCSVFRASGRLFWPVYELLFLLAWLTAIGMPGELGREKRFSAGMGALAALVVLQLGDLSPALRQKHGSIWVDSPVWEGNHSVEPDAEEGNPMVSELGSYHPEFYESQDWQQVLKSYQRAELLNYHHDYNLAAFLMKFHLQSNILPANRGDFQAAQERCQRMILELYQGQEMEEDVLYLTNDPLLAGQLQWNLHENLEAYDLGEYTGFGRKRENVTAKRAVLQGEPGRFPVIALDSPDWNYLRGAEENELLLPATAVLEWELSQGAALQLGEEQIKVEHVELYSNEYIRDYLYVRCMEGVDLTEWRKAPAVQVIRSLKQE
ncbi:MAG: hypothetical protein HFI33_10380 [Lachnospiraceae bacterium]|nr:hypothetical protein [Lachnospiraceae bacterium]